MKTILITGSNGFIGKNLKSRLIDNNEINIKTFDRDNLIEDLNELLPGIDLIYHLAGVNRSDDDKQFIEVNYYLLLNILNKIKELGLKIPIIFTSSIQALQDNPYGRSKKMAEDLLIDYSKKNDVTVFIFRLPNCFGKWSKPNYNSVVATFCYNISHDLEITISDKNIPLKLAYIDDVIEEFIECLYETNKKVPVFKEIKNIYKMTLGDLAKRIIEIKELRKKLTIPNFSESFTRSLYSTYISYLDKKDIIIDIDKKNDKRGSFSELIKSSNLGQVSVSYSNTGVTRGNHFHNSKIEIFFILKGKALVKQRPLFKEDIMEFEISDENICAVEIIPGCAHNITNIGKEKMILLIWSNEIYNINKPDTYNSEV